MIGACSDVFFGSVATVIFNTPLVTRASRPCKVARTGGTPVLRLTTFPRLQHHLHQTPPPCARVLRTSAACRLLSLFVRSRATRARWLHQEKLFRWAGR